MLISRELVRKLGGPRKTAQVLDVDQSTLWRWLNVSFSPEGLEKVQALCRKRGLPDNPDAILAAPEKLTTGRNKRGKPGRTQARATTRRAGSAAGSRTG